MTKQIFVNLPVKDLSKTIDFFTKLGFTFNPKFTDENSTCMIIGENIFAILLVEKSFKGFIPGKDIPDTSKSTEVLMGITAESREEVDEMIDQVVAAGGKEFRVAQDHGWMYGRAFHDLDGHIWEVFFIDESQMPD
jgi:uncharacterized protein